MTGIRAGKLTERITLRAPFRTDEPGGGHSETMRDAGTVRAEAEPLAGDERAEYMQTGMTEPTRFRIRYRADLTGATEIVWRGNRYNVSGIADVKAARRVLDIMTDRVRG